MRRRDFITLLGGAATVWPLTAHAQRTGWHPLILGKYGDTGPDGWTSIVPSNGHGPSGKTSNIIYVSNSTGVNAPGNGTLEHPVKTLEYVRGTNPIRQIGTLRVGLRDGYPDWVLLKMGDTWTDEGFGFIQRSGASAEEPMVFSSYDPKFPLVANPATGGAQPLIKCSNAIKPNAYGFATISTGGNYLALMGLDFYAYTRDPSLYTPNPPPDVSSSMMGCYFPRGCNWILIEDCKFRFFIESSFIPKTALGPVIIRRNVIADSYAIGRGQGIYVDGVGTFICEENLFIHNGWNDGVTNARASVFNHNLYMSEHVYDGTHRPIIRGNIFAYDGAGCQFRIGGNVYDNLFVHNPLVTAWYQPASYANYFQNNVILDACQPTNAYQPLGNGLGTGNAYSGVFMQVGTTEISGNIFASANADVTAGSNCIHLIRGSNAFSIHDNVFYNWAVNYAIQEDGFNGIHSLKITNPGSGYSDGGSPYYNVALSYSGTAGSGTGAKATITVSGGVVTDVHVYYAVLGSGSPESVAPGQNYQVGDLLTASFGGGSNFQCRVTSVAVNKIGNNIIDLAAAHPEVFPDPTRTVGSYAGTIGLTATLDGFLNAARVQSKNNWIPSLTANNGVNRYIRAGFGL